MDCSRLRFGVLVFVIAAVTTRYAHAQSKSSDYRKPKQLAVLADDAISESSGLARSLSRPGAFWTHNDSGDRPRLFLINRNGETLATFRVDGAEAIDWEDMCSFRLGDTNYLLIGDVGDNAAKRAVVRLYVVKEPALGGSRLGKIDSLSVSRTITFTYENGPRDCESLAVDPMAKKIYVISKDRSLSCTAYELPLSETESPKPLTAKPIAKLWIPLPTAMDISADGKRAVIVTYGNAFMYDRTPDEPWRESLARKPKLIQVPRRRQGEAICFGADGTTLFLTSEGVAQPFWEIRIE